MTIIVYTISTPAPIDAEDYDLKQYQPTGWCYVCGSAAWVWDRSGPLCPSHAVDCDPRARPLPMDGQDYHVFGEE